MILYINACVRKESRTNELAGYVLSKLEDKEVKEVKLEEIDFPKVTQDFLNKRYAYIDANDYSNPDFELAKDFAEADTIVIGAPFWDLSFPSSLKAYFEQICILGLTFYYKDDEPYGLCKAKDLYYVSTAGGPIYSEEYGYGYVRALAHTFYGIENTHFFKAENLDIAGADPAAILKKAREEIDAYFND